MFSFGKDYTAERPKALINRKNGKKYREFSMASNDKFPGQFRL